MRIKCIIHWIGEAYGKLPEHMKPFFSGHFTVIEHEENVSVMTSSQINIAFFYLRQAQQQEQLNRALSICENLNKQLVIIHHGVLSKNSLEWIHVIKASIDLSRTDLTDQKLNELFSSLSKQMKNHTGSTKRRYHQLLEKMIFDILHYIDKNINSPLREEDVSAYFNYTPHYFSKVFRQATGWGFKAYITNKRISKAKKLLAGKEGISISQVAYQCGYGDVSYFSRVFKKNIGITPGKYRQLNQGR